MADGTPPGYTGDEKMPALDDASHEDAADPGEDIYQSVDPLDPRKVSLDIFEMYCHEMVNTPTIGRRAYLIIQMRYMVKRLIGHQYPYGRLYNRTFIANVTARICARQPYSNDDASDEDDNHKCQLEDCLVDFTPEKWKKVIEQFESLRESLLRKDAALLVLQYYDGDEDSDKMEDEVPSCDESVNPLLESSKEFTQSYNKVLDWMKFHMCLSHIQPQFEKALQKGSLSEQKGAFADKEAVVISNDDILAFENEFEQAFGTHDSDHAAILSSLLETKRGRLQLKEIDEMREIYESNARLFDLARFQSSFLKLMRRWSEMVLPAAELTELGYGSTTPAGRVDNKENISSLGSAFAITTTKQQRQQKRRRIDSTSSDEIEENEQEKVVGDDDDGEEEKEDNLDRLKRTRKAFMKNVEDPLDDCVAKAKSARTRSAAQTERRPGTPSFLKKKTSSYKIIFTDSEDDGSVENASEEAPVENTAEEAEGEMGALEDSEEDEAVKLSEVPKRYKPAPPKKSPKKIAVSVARKPKQGKRKRFTESEDSAIRSGVEKFGEGRWADIKSYYHIDLADRTSVQIKDRWRTLNK